MGQLVFLPIGELVIFCFHGKCDAPFMQHPQVAAAARLKIRHMPQMSGTAGQALVSGNGAIADPLHPGQICGHTASSSATHQVLTSATDEFWGKIPVSPISK